MSSTHVLKRAAQIAEGVAAKLNGRNLIRKGDDTMTTFQFVWEAADEKIFNTAEMILDPTAIWRAAYDCIFSKKGCVKTKAPESWNCNSS